MCQFTEHSHTEKQTSAFSFNSVPTAVCFMPSMCLCVRVRVWMCVRMCVCVSSTGHLHSVAELTHTLGAVRVRACSVAGAVHRAAAGQGGSARACQSSHTGRGH